MSRGQPMRMMNLDEKELCPPHCYWPPQIFGSFVASEFSTFDVFKFLCDSLLTYSRVHISSDTAFLKILKKPSIVQE